MRSTQVSMRSRFIAWTILVVASVVQLGCGEGSSSMNGNSSLSSTPLKTVDDATIVDTDAKATTWPQGASIYADKFEGMFGTRTSYRENAWEYEDGNFTRQVFPFADAQGVGLATQILEDAATVGADSKPGVMTLTWQAIPSQFKYSGFAYMGLRERMFHVPEIAALKSVDGLSAFQLSFKFKGLNAGHLERAFRISCRMEVNVPDSYDVRLELPRLYASNDWQTYEAVLSEGQNSLNFLAAVQANPNQPFKIAWSQIGSRHGLLAGDTLLIDDVVITTKKEIPKAAETSFFSSTAQSE